MEVCVLPCCVGRLRRLLVTCSPLVLETGDDPPSVFCCLCREAGDIWATVGPSVYSLQLPVILIWSRGSTAGVRDAWLLFSPGSGGPSRACGLPSSCGVPADLVAVGDCPWCPPPPSLPFWLLESISGLKGHSGWQGTHLKSWKKTHTSLYRYKPCKWCHANHNWYVYEHHYGNKDDPVSHSWGQRRVCWVTE